MNEIDDINNQIHAIHDQCYQADCKECISSCHLSQEIERLKKQRYNLEVAIQCDDNWTEY